MFATITSSPDKLERAKLLVLMASILSDPIVFCPSLLGLPVEPFPLLSNVQGDVAAFDMALHLMNSLLQSCIREWIQSSLVSDPSGGEIIAIAAPFFAGNSWLFDVVQTERQRVLDAALVTAVDLFIGTPSVAPSCKQTVTPAVQSGLSLCKLRRAGLLPGDVCNVPQASSRDLRRFGRRAFY